jgi:hypothetical protein
VHMAKAKSQAIALKAHLGSNLVKAYGFENTRQHTGLCGNTRINKEHRTELRYTGRAMGDSRLTSIMYIFEVMYDSAPN